jgi:thiol-disulfide isomerase/thioredoxin
MAWHVLLRGKRKVWLMIWAVLLVVAPATAAREELSGSVKDLVFLDDQGREIHLTEMIAQGPTLLYFWATWCKGCRGVQPTVADLAQKHRGKIQVIGINVGGLDSVETIRKYRSRYAISYPLLRDPENLALKAYRIIAIPAFVVLDHNGKVRFRGNMPPPNLEELL